MNCDVCGKRMSPFKNDDGTYRYVCANTSGHAAIETVKQQGSTAGTANKGQKRPKSRANLGDKAKKKKK